MFSNNHLIGLTFHSFSIVFLYYWFTKLHSNRYKLLLFLWFIIPRLLFFGVLVFIFASLIVDMFVTIYRLSIHWYWNLSPGVIANFMCAVSKPDKRVCLPLRFVEGRGEDAGWIFRHVCFNWLLCLI